MLDIYLNIKRSADIKIQNMVLENKKKKEKISRNKRNSKKREDEDKEEEEQQELEKMKGGKVPNLCIGGNHESTPHLW